MLWRPESDLRRTLGLMPLRLTPPEDEWIALREATEIIHPEAKTEDAKRKALKAVRGLVERGSLDYARPKPGRIVTTREWAEQYKNGKRQPFAWVEPWGLSSRPDDADGHWRKVAEELMAENAALRSRIAELESK
jgi:hypothetical protein